MSRTRSLKGLALLGVVALVLAFSAVCEATIECYPCAQCDGRVCFILDKNGDTIGYMASACCSNKQY